MAHSPTAPLEDEPPSYDTVINSPICNRSFGSVQEDFRNAINQNYEVSNGEVPLTPEGRNVAEFRSANRTHVEAFNDITDLNGLPIIGLSEDPPTEERSGRSERGILTKKGLYCRLAVIILLGVFIVITIAALIYILVNSEKVNQRLESIDKQGLEKLKQDVKSLSGNWSIVSQDLTTLDYKVTKIKNKLKELEDRIEVLENVKGVERLVIREYRSESQKCQAQISVIAVLFFLILLK